MFTKTLQTLRARLWAELPARRGLRLAIQALRVADAMATTLARGTLSLHGMSLVYSTLLSLVPLLALAFSLLKALGVHNQLLPVLMESLRGLGPAQAYQVASGVVAFVEKVQVGVLGSLGMAMLLFSALSLIKKVENAFNLIWQVERPRPFARRIGEYFAVLTIGPAVVFSALGLTASTLNHTVFSWLQQVPFGGLVLAAGESAVPYLMLTCLFSFLYAFVPNTQVRLAPALLGGLVAGFMWQTASYGFASFVARAVSYNAIYSGFAIGIFVLIWLYLGWLILLIGAQLAFFAQYPQRMNPLLAAQTLNSYGKEWLSLALMHRLSRSFAQNQPLPSRAVLASELGQNEDQLQRLIQPLIDADLLCEDGPGLGFVRDPATISVAQLWQLLRQSPLASHHPSSLAAQQWLLALHSATNGQSLKDWAVSTPAALSR